jgi:hypothetical protein
VSWFFEHPILVLCAERNARGEVSDERIDD